MTHTGNRISESIVMPLDQRILDVPSTHAVSPQQHQRFTPENYEKTGMIRAKAGGILNI